MGKNQLQLYDMLFRCSTEKHSDYGCFSFFLLVAKVIYAFQKLKVNSILFIGKFFRPVIKMTKCSTLNDGTTASVYCSSVVYMVVVRVCVFLLAKFMPNGLFCDRNQKLTLIKCKVWAKTKKSISIWVGLGVSIVKRRPQTILSDSVILSILNTFLTIWDCMSIVHYSHVHSINEHCI